MINITTRSTIDWDKVKEVDLILHGTLSGTKRIKWDDEVLIRNAQYILTFLFIKDLVLSNPPHLLSEKNLKEKG